MSNRRDRRLRAYQAQAVEAKGYAHFAKRVAERCEVDVGDPHAFAAKVHRAVLNGDETVAIRLLATHGEVEGGVFYRLFHEGRPIGYALIGEDYSHWPITFYTQKQFRSKRHADKARRKGRKVWVPPNERGFTPRPGWAT